MHVIKFPVPSFRGIWWGVGQSRWFFSIRLTPDHALLVYEPNKNGKWPLIRVRNWWTTSPLTETLDIPCFSAHDGDNLASLQTDLQVTSDGQYAVLIAAAQWGGAQHGSAPTIARTVGFPRQADALISVVDLSRWSIVGNVHTAGLALGADEGEQILNPKTLLLKGSDWNPEKTILHYTLLSLPSFERGPACTFEVPRMSWKEMKKTEQERLSRYGTLCADVLKASGLNSMQEMDAFIQTGQAPKPQAFSDLSPLNDSFLQSPDGGWYGLDSLRSMLSKFSASGEERGKKEDPNLLCKNQPVQGPAWDCTCGIGGFSEDRHAFLAACLTQRDSLLEGRAWIRQWLAVFSADDLSEIGLIKLANKETRQAITTVDNHTYVLTVVLGNELAVYAVPRN